MSGHAGRLPRVPGRFVPGPAPGPHSPPPGRHQEEPALRRRDRQGGGRGGRDRRRGPGQPRPGAALRLGYQIARQGGAAYIVTTDADGQYNPLEVESLLAPVVAGRADFVTGSRRMGSEETSDPVRRAGVRFFALLVSALTGQQVGERRSACGPCGPS
ncbi:MAG TPA: glycosyltransferase [Trebonia sp.]|nr:glycosyltransferase [Trebonia sp.]